MLMGMDVHLTHDKSEAECTFYTRYISTCEAGCLLPGTHYKTCRQGTREHEQVDELLQGKPQCEET